MCRRATFVLRLEALSIPSELYTAVLNDITTTAEPTSTIATTTTTTTTRMTHLGSNLRAVTFRGLWIHVANVLV